MVGIGTAYRYKTAKMRHRITVKYRTTSQSDGTGQPIETFVNRFTGEPAAFEQVSGGEFLRGRKIDATTTVIFTVNYRPGYETTDKIEFDGTTYGIVRIDTPDGVKRYLEIQAKTST